MLKDDDFEVTNGSLNAKKSINAPSAFLSDLVDKVRSIDIISKYKC